MGKPSDDDDPAPSPNPATPLGESASSISLHHTSTTSTAAQQAPLSSAGAISQHRYFDEDPTELQADDLPPLYSDHELDRPADPSSSSSVTAIIDPLLPAGAPPLQVQPFVRDKNTDAEYYVDRRLDTDPVFLLSHLERLALVPPRPFVHIRGTHHQSVRKSDGKGTERREIVDFDLHIELTHLLYRDIHTRTPFLREVATPGPFDKVRRGTVFPTRAPGFGGSSRGAGDEESGATPSLEEWCHRFCASRAGLRVFTLERRIDGWDADLVRAKLEALVRATNYRGHVKVDFPVRNARVDVYNSCRTNRWRLTKWIEMLFVFTLLFLFSWPWLFFRTARWEVATVVWGVSATDERGVKRYASLSEEQWYNMWARPIHRAVLQRRQCTLDQADLREEADGPEPRGGFAGAVRAGVEAMGVVNRSFGWGDLAGTAPSPASTTSLAGTSHDLPLTTPYYTATIPIWLDLIASPTEWAASFLSDEAKEVLAVLGGLVLVFPVLPAHDRTRELIREVGRVARDGLGGWEWDGVGLAVGVGEGAAAAEEWDELCAEAGLEFVQLTGKDDDGRRNEFGEKTGIYRAKEALEANDWAQPDAPDLSSEFGDMEEPSDKPASDDHRDRSEDLDPDNLDFGFDRADFEGLRRAIWSAGQVGDEDDPAEEVEEEKARMASGVRGLTRGAGTATAGPETSGGQDGDKSAGLDEDDVAKVERMMRKLQAVREAGEGMGQEQRRRMAARAVEEVMKEL
ncbi:hypothetical protein ACRE_078420 [Hapsidospora chrysogenum ATCC 11550]|uniref:Uncharacterized protein n=1 Tax=Hapsidospora chrysogenum (strain ATCC 11550 / CBS 779.69 / DSM 880 / IAM 14645 / JCM 23072 / IMI 49137) TaxID=857340 RepID=A0A086SWG6_HAPC1|nr:hypothetical protein ACRE_078420 [Hapsidospora chrysogenum ATCC 11550]